MTVLRGIPLEDSYLLPQPCPRCQGELRGQVLGTDDGVVEVIFCPVCLVYALA